MRIVLIGAVEFSAHALHELIRMGSEVVGVCTLQESPANADHVDLTPIAERHDISVRITPDVNAEDSLAWIQSCAPDVIFCFGWSRLIRRTLLRLPAMGVVGYHPAALPANRGRHPLIWALALGLNETASTFFLMDEGADSGDILSQVPLVIAPTDDAASLYSRMIEVAMQQLRDFVPLLQAGTLRPQPQDDSKANAWRRRGMEDGRIDWRMAAESIHNLVRALSPPYPGAHFEHQGMPIKVWKTEVEANAPLNIEPGKVLSSGDEGLVVKAGIGAIRLLAYEPRLSIAPGSYL